MASAFVRFEYPWRPNTVTFELDVKIFKRQIHFLIVSFCVRVCCLCVCVEVKGFSVLYEWYLIIFALYDQFICHVFQLLVSKHLLYEWRIFLSVLVLFSMVSCLCVYVCVRVYFAKKKSLFCHMAWQRVTHS